MERKERATSSKRIGFALIEIIVVAAVLMIGSLGFVSLFGAASDVSRSNRETALAVEACGRVLEGLEGFESHEDVVLLHDADPSNDPAGLDPLEGVVLGGFAVDGLSAPEGDEDGLVGRVIFPVDPVTGEIRADVDDFDVERLRGVVERLREADGAAAGILLVPVIVRLEWSAGGRIRSHEAMTLLRP